MKLQNYTFLANANRKKGKRGTALFLLLLFSVIALVLITSVTSMLHRVMDGFTNVDPARRIEINSFFPEPGKGVILTEEVLDDIRSLTTCSRWISTTGWCGKFLILLLSQTNTGKTAAK